MTYLLRVDILVILNDPPYGTERSYNGLRLALNLAKKPQVQLRIFLMADAVACVLNRPLPELRRASGLYHVTSQGQTSWCGFADAIINGAVLHGRVTVEAILTSDYPTAATRPAYSVLDANLFYATFGWSAPTWQDGLQRCLTDRNMSA